MLNFADTPYAFYPPKPSRLMMRLARFVNRHCGLPGKRHRIARVTVVNPEVVEQIRRENGARLLLLPNHSTHSDPEIMMEVLSQIRVHSCFMAAYDVFQRSKFNAWLMQKLGAFSVDREGSDSRALKTAVGILVEGRYALTIFPEGNVYFMNDRVTPFLDGASYIGLKAQKELKDAPVFALPVSVKATHLTDQRETIRGMMEQVAEGVGTKLDREADFREEVRRIGVRALEKNLSQRGILAPESGGDDLRSLLQKAAESIIVRMEQKMELSVRPNADLTDRIRKIRQAIHRIRTDPGKETEQAVAASWADEAILALRILSYAGNYVDENPTQDRTGETVEKLKEDVTSRLWPAYGDRHATVDFGEPIDLRPFANDTTRKQREVIQELTHTVERAVQEGLDRLNADNPHPGGEPFSQ